MFKTTMYAPLFNEYDLSWLLPFIFRSSLPVILSLLTLWLSLFIFFSILFVEVFSLTKWNTGKNRNQNYSAMSKALVMLVFMTSGCILLSYSCVAHFLPTEHSARAGINLCTTSEHYLLQHILSFFFFYLSTVVAPLLIPDVLIRRRPNKTQTAGVSVGPIRFS